MFKRHLAILTCLTVMLLSFAVNGAPPTVIKTIPVLNDDNVDASISHIHVIFDTEMMDNSWSWTTGGKSKFPEVTAKPFYREDVKEILLPVKLKPNTEYEVWINSNKHQNFKSKSGQPALPFVLIFKTGNSKPID